MKHLKNLMYSVVQWHLKEVVIIGLLMGGVATAILPDRWFIIFPMALLGSFIESMITQHRREKTLKR